MNISIFEKAIQKAEKIDIDTGDQLMNVIDKYPYFQLARALYLKSLRNRNSTMYNAYLGITAGLTTNREILYEFIENIEVGHQENKQLPEELRTSNEKAQQVIEQEVEADQQIIQQIIEDKQHLSQPTVITPEEKQKIEELEEILEVDILAEELIEKKRVVLIDDYQRDQDNMISLEDNSKKTENQLKDSIKNASSQEQYSFEDWMSVIKENKDNNPVINKKKKIERYKKEKNELIENFLQTNPKIKTNDALKETLEVNIADQREGNDKTELMTETLARIYLEQRKYDQAIQAYKILILKSPEKSSYFAEKIKQIKILKIENS